MTENYSLENLEDELTDFGNSIETYFDGGNIDTGTVYRNLLIFNGKICELITEAKSQELECVTKLENMHEEATEYKQTMENSKGWTITKIKEPYHYGFSPIPTNAEAQ